jgi:transcriptional regulator with XRE-family HTH domain
MSFGERLRTAREKAGLTQAQAAALWKVSKRTVEHWEKNTRLPPAERDAITRERLLARLTGQAAPGNPNTEMTGANPNKGQSHER